MTMKQSERTIMIKAMLRTAAVVLTVGVVSAFTSTGAQAEKVQLLLGGGGYTTGSWYMGSVAITEVVNKANPDVNITTIPGGGVSNCKAVAKGRADFAFAYQDIAFAAYKRQDSFKEKFDYESIRGLVSFAPNALQVVVKRDSDIKSFKDLVGKNVIAGYVGSGYERAFRQMLEVYGITPKDIEAKGGKYIYLSMNDAVSMMKDGLADVMVTMSGIPLSSYLLDLSSAMPLRVLGVESDKILEFQKRHPGWDSFDIPADTYGMKESVSSVASWSGLITNKDVSEDVVYKFIKAVNEQYEKIARVHPVFGHYKKEKALAGISVPLHPGAEKYWKEIGVIK